MDRRCKLAGCESLDTTIGLFPNLAAEYFLIAADKDSQWAEFIIHDFLRPMPLPILQGLKPLLLKYAQDPSEYHKICGIDVSAKEILNERFGENFD